MMLLKKSLLIIVLLIANTVFSQNKSREEIITLMAEDTCECIKSDPETFSSKTKSSKKEIALGLCMVKSYNKRKKQSKVFKKEKLDLEKLGEEIGFEMVTICSTEFMNIFSEEELVGFVEDEDDVAPSKAEKDESDLNLNAKLVKLNNDVVSNFSVEDSFGKKHTFIIVEDFDGYELLSNSNIGKEITVYFKEVNYFDLSEKRYVKKKVVKYIETL